MTDEVSELWARAAEALLAAEALRDLSPDGSASRAYYAAFHAVSALFAAEGRAFTKHSAVEAAVHRDLVKAGAWPEAVGKAYSRLLAWRQIGDYGGGRHISSEVAEEALASARLVLDQVREQLEG